MICWMPNSFFLAGPQLRSSLFSESQTDALILDFVYIADRFDQLYCDIYLQRVKMCTTTNDARKNYTEKIESHISM